MARAKKPRRPVKKTQRKTLPLDKEPEAPIQQSPAVAYVAGLYATIINQFFADNNQNRLNELVGTILSMTISVMKRYLGDEITVYELGRALRTMENTPWITPGDAAAQAKKDKHHANGARTKAKVG